MRLAWTLADLQGADRPVTDTSGSARAPERTVTGVGDRPGSGDRIGAVRAALGAAGAQVDPVRQRRSSRGRRSSNRGMPVGGARDGVRCGTSTRPRAARPGRPRPPCHHGSGGALRRRRCHRCRGPGGVRAGPARSDRPLGPRLGRSDVGDVLAAARSVGARLLVPGADGWPTGCTTWVRTRRSSSGHGRGAGRRCPRSPSSAPGRTRSPARKPRRRSAPRRRTPVRDHQWRCLRDRRRGAPCRHRSRCADGRGPRRRDRPAVPRPGTSTCCGTSRGRVRCSPSHRPGHGRHGGGSSPGTG